MRHCLISKQGSFCTCRNSDAAFLLCNWRDPRGDRSEAVLERGPQERFFPYTQVDVAWFPEGAGGDRFDEKVFKGPLARTMREALSYIQVVVSFPGPNRSIRLEDLQAGRAVSRR